MGGRIQRGLVYAVSALLAAASLTFAAIPSTCQRAGQVALTFDFGPGLHTGRLLDELFRQKISATFHVSARLFRNTTLTEYVRRAHLEGHEVGIFIPREGGGSLPSGAGNSPVPSAQQLVQQIMTASNWITSITGSRPRYIRFEDERGMMEPQLRGIIERQLGLTVTKAEIDIDDDGDQMELVWDSLVKEIAPSGSQGGSFILGQHDTRSNAAVSVQRIIRHLLDKGYRIVPLAVCVPARARVVRSLD